MDVTVQQRTTSEGNTAGNRRKRIRPSRARGLRTRTGWSPKRISSSLTHNSLTCRERRVKCDDGRTCQYAQATSQIAGPVHPPGATNAPADEAVPAHQSDSPEASWGDLNGPNEQSPPGFDSAISASPLTLSQASLLNISPFEWYDLLARDAINHIQRLNDTSGGDSRWKFPEIALSRRQSPARECPDSRLDPFKRHEEQQPAVTDRENQPWNTTTRIELSEIDLTFFRYYIDVVGPILDLFDRARHFSNVVPHLALRNTGLLKSVLAVGAKHMSLGVSDIPDGDSISNAMAPNANVQTPLTSTGLSPDSETAPAHMATQYYYETLQYLSQTLLYPSYADSHEILATATMISTYEMFDSDSASNGGVWEQHLRGSFWIQRSQDNDGESVDGLRQAVWWAWLRQDIWAAFQAGRPTITFWRARKPLDALDSDELGTRIVYICGKCVKYASSERVTPNTDPRERIEHGDQLLRMLDDWHRALPASYHNITVASATSLDLNTAFPPIWIHPPNHAGAMQMYHFARAIVLLNQPTMGGLTAYLQRDKQLTESIKIVCGIANSCQEHEVAMAFVNVQALFGGKCLATPIVNFTDGYQVGQFVRSAEMRGELLRILENMIKISKFPAKGLANRLKKGWQE
ncbi:hypothetical protein N7478_003860 [Penicillium angulare]|uniref:uncharacterized protein n=1 Tax=Penicillium angulare TaxID=116970 RepID=UPI002540669C|nr:uncharacterized protein N7478_003860 [Penicillium angulare]KAJ5288174.1 hypothetical protein N7478_003860 [Penicillium angulare]